MSFDRKPVADAAKPPLYGAQSPPQSPPPTELPHHERPYASSPSPGLVLQPYPGQYNPQPQMQEVQHNMPPADNGRRGDYAPQTGYQQQAGYFQHPAPVGGTTIPIASLTSSPAPVTCPSCGQRTTTAITHVIGNTTHAWGAGICFCFCLGFIPYLMTSLKDVEHRCPRCGVHLATWHKSGRTDVKMHG